MYIYNSSFCLTLLWLKTLKRTYQTAVCPQLVKKTCTRLLYVRGLLNISLIAAWQLTGYQARIALRRALRPHCPILGARAIKRGSCR